VTVLPVQSVPERGTDGVLDHPRMVDPDLPAPTAKHTETCSAAGAVGAVDRTRVGDQAHPTGRRTTRQTAVAIVAAAQNGTYACALECVSRAASNLNFWRRP
jgi:hypothetical protein